MAGVSMEDVPGLVELIADLNAQGVTAVLRVPLSQPLFVLGTLFILVVCFAPGLHHRDRRPGGYVVAEEARRTTVGGPRGFARINRLTRVTPAPQPRRSSAPEKLIRATSGVRAGGMGEPCPHVPG